MQPGKWKIQKNIKMLINQRKVKQQIKKYPKIAVALAAFLVVAMSLFMLTVDSGWLKTSIAPMASKDLMTRMKTKGCVADGLLTGYGGAFSDKVRMLKNSQCDFLHRSIETWNKPPDFEAIKKNMEVIKKETDKKFIYSLFIAESINVKSEYFAKTHKFDFSKMCQEGTQGDWGPDTCKPSLSKSEYKHYVKYITEQAIDLGVQDIVFGQIYYQDDNWEKEPRIKEVVEDIRKYAASKGREIAIGAQTNTIDDEKYLKNFDYITGGIGQDPETGYIEDSGPCWSYYQKKHNYCWAMMWNKKYMSKANNVLVYLDWNNDSYDDMNRFAKMPQQKRHSFLGNAYDFFFHRNVGFLLPLEAVLDGSGQGCYGAEKNFYSANNTYSCKDEKAINGILARQDYLPKRAEYITQSVPLKMETGKKYDVTVTMRNNSLLDWSKDEHIQFGASNPTDNKNWGLSRVTLGDKDRIKPGQKKEFAFSVTAPSKPGKYEFQWRMVQKDDQWFGQPSANVSIEVLNPAILLQSPSAVK